MNKILAEIKIFVSITQDLFRNFLSLYEIILLGRVLVVKGTVMRIEKSTDK